MLELSLMPDDWLVNTYLCSYCNNFFSARPDSIDRCTFAACPRCSYSDLSVGREMVQP